MPSLETFSAIDYPMGRQSPASKAGREQHDEVTTRSHTSPAIRPMDINQPHWLGLTERRAGSLEILRKELIRSNLRKRRRLGPSKVFRGFEWPPLRPTG